MHGHISQPLMDIQEHPLTTHPNNIAWPNAARHNAFTQWLQTVAPVHGLNPSSLRSASSDASFRRYFRIDSSVHNSCIVMDAPPPQEDVQPFIHVAQLIQQAHLKAPHVLAQDVTNGFLLLTDLGATLYLRVLQDAVAQNNTVQRDTLMRAAIHTLVEWQTRVDATSLPAYDNALLRRELALFPEWCVGLECNTRWSAEDQQIWQDACEQLVQSALAQPTVAVHRDYMPRNLMVCNNAKHSAEPTITPGILDFQDAVHGPISYDVASLLRDAFISWEEEQEIDWAVRYWQAARAAKLPMPDDFGDFWRQLEWMGLQRHLKVLGIFSRLKHRDAKPHYSEDLPRFFNYAHKVSSRYNVLRPLSRLLEPLMGAQRVDAFY
jgi:N-acetylmuramate 1-kinase